MKRMLIALGAGIGGAMLLSTLDEYARPRGRASHAERLTEQALARIYDVLGADLPRKRVMRARAHVLGWALAGVATGAAAMMWSARQRRRIMYPLRTSTARA